jgi:hypothetical protein
MICFEVKTNEKGGGGLDSKKYKKIWFGSHFQMIFL